MKKTIKATLIVVLALVMAVSSCIIVAAENTENTNNDGSTVIVNDEGGTREYQLVWKYKSSGGHMYKRRWNKTLGQWYDPAWILVY